MSMEIFIRNIAIFINRHTLDVAKLKWTTLQRPQAALELTANTNIVCMRSPSANLVTSRFNAP